MNRIIALLAVGCSVIATFACTHDNATDTEAIKRKSFEAWIEAHAPQAMPLGDTGMYYEVLEEADNSSSGKVDVRGKWIDVNYRMCTLDGDIFYNRDEATARLIGTYDAYTHYVPERFYIASSWDSSSLPKGLYTTFTEIIPGATWRVYMPADMAFASSGFDMTGGYGYGGQIALDEDKAVMLDQVRITDIIENPQQLGDDQIRTLATTARPEGWGMYPNDTLRPGMYMDVLYRRNAQDTVPVGRQHAFAHGDPRHLDSVARKRHVILGQIARDVAVQPAVLIEVSPEVVSQRGSDRRRSRRIVDFNDPGRRRILRRIFTRVVFYCEREFIIKCICTGAVTPRRICANYQIQILMLCTVQRVSLRYLPHPQIIASSYFFFNLIRFVSVGINSLRIGDLTCSRIQRHTKDSIIPAIRHICRPYNTNFITTLRTFQKSIDFIRNTNIY